MNPRRPPRLTAARAEPLLPALLRRRPLLAFDFDGTLAPIVARPADAMTAPGLAGLLSILSTRLPVAVISGRARDDLQRRLGFTPTHAVGCHGAEDADDPDATLRRSRALDGLREVVRARSAMLADAGVTVEDKGAALALHHRLAPSRARAERAIRTTLAMVPPGIDTFGGKRVVNAVAAGSPDKAASLRTLVQRHHAGAALFAGDDLNDEPVFRSAPPDWLTLRMGRTDACTAARWRLDGPTDLARLLQQLARCLEHEGRGL